MKTGPRIAIDFGTTRTKVAFYNSEKSEAQLIPLGTSQREIIPSIFYIRKVGDGEILVGDDAMLQIDTDPAGIVREIKREIHKSGKLLIGKDRFMPTRVELASALLRMIRKRCEEEVFHGQAIEACTLTVPVAFTEQQRKSLEAAASQAGFHNIRLLEEPTSAARAWLESRGKRHGGHLVVVDIGGGTTDFSAVECREDRFVQHPRVLPSGFVYGGNDIDDDAFESLLAQQSQSYKNAFSQARDGLLVKLRGAREQLARGLRNQKLHTHAGVVHVGAHAFHEAENKFKNMLCEKLQSYLDLCKKEGIDSPVILLVGGASRISGLKDIISSLCSGSVITWETADFATVLGAVDFPSKELGFELVKQRNARSSYAEGLKAAIVDGVISQAEFDHLSSRKHQLGLSSEVALQLEMEILGGKLNVTKIIDQKTEKPLSHVTESQGPHSGGSAFESNSPLHHMNRAHSQQATTRPIAWTPTSDKPTPVLVSPSTKPASNPGSPSSLQTDWIEWMAMPLLVMAAIVIVFILISIVMAFPMIIPLAACAGVLYRAVTR